LGLTTPAPQADPLAGAASQGQARPPLCRTIPGGRAHRAGGLSFAAPRGIAPPRRLPCGAPKALPRRPSDDYAATANDGWVVLSPVRVRQARFQQGAWHVLVEWRSLSPHDTTWEPRELLVECYPDFQLEDELFPEEWRDVRAQEQQPAREQLAALRSTQPW